jgi:hypothetical protein
MLFMICLINIKKFVWNKTASRTCLWCITCKHVTINYDTSKKIWTMTMFNSVYIEQEYTYPNVVKWLPLFNFKTWLKLRIICLQIITSKFHFSRKINEHVWQKGHFIKSRFFLDLLEIAFKKFRISFSHRTQPHNQSLLSPCNPNFCNLLLFFRERCQSSPNMCNNEATFLALYLCWKGRNVLPVTKIIWILYCTEYICNCKAKELLSVVPP